jgi:hypothetical protein
MRGGPKKSRREARPENVRIVVLTYAIERTKRCGGERLAHPASTN